MDRSDVFLSLQVIFKTQDISATLSVDERKISVSSLKIVLKGTLGINALNFKNSGFGCHSQTFLRIQGKQKKNNTILFLKGFKPRSLQSVLVDSLQLQLPPPMP